jgi:hypothetical protein
MDCSTVLPDKLWVDIKFDMTMDCDTVGYDLESNNYIGIEYIIEGKQIAPPEYNSGRPYTELHFNYNQHDTDRRPRYLYFRLSELREDGSTQHVTGSSDTYYSGYSSRGFYIYPDRTYLFQIYNADSNDFDHISGVFSFLSYAIPCETEVCQPIEIPAPSATQQAISGEVQYGLVAPDDTKCTNSFSTIYHFRTPSDVSENPRTKIRFLKADSNSTIYKWGFNIRVGSPTGQIVNYYPSYPTTYDIIRDYGFLADTDYYITICSAFYLPGEFVFEYYSYNQCRTYHDILPVMNEEFDIVGGCYTEGLPANKYTHEHMFSIPSNYASQSLDVTFRCPYFNTGYYVFMYLYNADTGQLINSRRYMNANSYFRVQLFTGNYKLAITSYYTYRQVRYHLNIECDIQYLTECEMYVYSVVDGIYDPVTEKKMNDWIRTKIPECLPDPAPEDCTDKFKNNFLQCISKYGPIPPRHYGMTPSKNDIEIWRGTTFELELVSQFKNYVYDPAVHYSNADKKRTHAENLEYYGFDYEYIDFASIYTRAELVIRKPWAAQTKAGDPIFTLTTEPDGGLELTNKSIRIGIPAEVTNNIEFDSGVYELNLIIAENLSDTDIRAGVEPNDKVDKLVYGSVTVMGKK